MKHLPGWIRATRDRSRRKARHRQPWKRATCFRAELQQMRVVFTTRPRLLRHRVDGKPSLYHVRRDRRTIFVHALLVRNRFARPLLLSTLDLAWTRWMAEAVVAHAAADGFDDETVAVARKLLSNN